MGAAFGRKGVERRQAGRSIMAPLTAPRSNFDVDLDFGRTWELQVCSILEGDGSLEIKADRLWHSTGNLAFEIRRGGGKTGLLSSKAKWWISVLTKKENPRKTEMILIWDVQDLIVKLRKLCMSNRARIVYGGDGKNTEIVLVPLKELLPQWEK